MKVLLFTLIRSFTFELAVPADKIEGRVFGVTRPYVKGDNTSGSQLPVILRSRMAKPKVEGNLVENILKYRDQHLKYVIL